MIDNGYVIDCPKHGRTAAIIYQVQPPTLMCETCWKDICEQSRRLDLTRTTDNTGDILPAPLQVSMSAVYHKSPPPGPPEDE